MKSLRESLLDNEEIIYKNTEITLEALIDSFYETGNDNYLNLIKSWLDINALPVKKYGNKFGYPPKSKLYIIIDHFSITLYIKDEGGNKWVQIGDKMIRRGTIYPYVRSRNLIYKLSISDHREMFEKYYYKNE